jgi:hypothetical protein
MCSFLCNRLNKFEVRTDSFGLRMLHERESALLAVIYMHGFPEVAMADDGRLHIVVAAELKRN